MVLIFYNLALIVALVIGSPWWLWKMATTRKYREGLWERLGAARPLPKRGGRPLIWVHAVSVGEVLAVTRLVQALDAALPNCFVAVSTTTRTGQALARERFGAARVFYSPLDLPWAVHNYLTERKPRLLILAETEFWPNLLSGCFRREIPVAVVNARISDRSWPRYRRLRWLWRPILSRLSAVLAQSEIDAERLKAIGCLPERVRVAGNLKFDVRAAEESAATRLFKRSGAGLRFIVAGSTLEGEEALLLEAWPCLLAADPGLVLILAPRHPERFEAVADVLERSSFKWIRRSHWPTDPAGEPRLLEPREIEPGKLGPGEIDFGQIEPRRNEPRQIVLLDTIGELASIYSLAAVAFVGGSLVPAGGHNPLEPAQFGVPIVMGPHYANFRAIVEELRSRQAIRIVPKEELSVALLYLLRDSAAAAAMGARARQIFARQAGATERCVQALSELLAGEAVAERGA
jgi:3-deoxy-D-manno-octulosonic-acid transferase